MGCSLPLVMRRATAFLQGQLELDDFGYIITAPDSTQTSIPGATPWRCRLKGIWCTGWHDGDD